MIIDDVVTVALLGIRGAPPQWPTLPDDVAAVLPAHTADPETQLLDVAASVALYSLAGCKSHQGFAPSQRCEASRSAECSVRASDLLAQAMEDRLQPMLIEWLELAALANVRPPHFLLPKLLDAAAAHKSLQPPVIAVIGERGCWLTQFNARWQFTNQALGASEDVWQTGNSQQRAEALRDIRHDDPAKARALVLASWQDDVADDRAQWIKCLLEELSDADEKFLETCLDDRSIRVREAAVDLLARLPKSKFVARMVDRLRPLIAFTPGTSGKLLKLKRATPPSLVVRLPDTCDKGMQRDGITEKPKETLGPKQWWLLQIVANVPLSFWIEEFSVAPAALVEALPKDFAKVLIRGWLSALSRLPEPEWIEPLVTAAKSDVRIEEGVLMAVPLAQRPAVLEATLKASGPQAFALSTLFEVWRPLDERTSQVLLKAVELSVLLSHGAHFYLHPHALQTLEDKLARQESTFYRRQVDQALSVISLRRELHRELST